MVDYLERVLAGPGGVVLVEGEPGVGKTRLALEAAEDAEWRGFEVSWGSCTPGALRPFAPLVEVLESLSSLRAEQLSEQVTPVWLREAMRLAPGLSGAILSSSASASLRPAEESSRMKESLVHTLGALGRIAPHLVIIDDVHWADEDSLSVLTQLGSRLAASRMLLLLLYRSEEGRGDPEVWDALRALDRDAGLGRVVLSPLSVFELGDMVKRILGLSDLEPSLASSLHRRTGGNALFALETLHALRDQGLFEVGDDPASVLTRQLAGQAIPVAARVRSVIDSRISLLGDNVSTVYEVAAVCGDRVDIDLLAIGSDLPRRSVLDAVDELMHRGLIREDDDGSYGITHDQVRQVVYERIETERRKLLHRRLGEVMAETNPDDVEAIGHHFREAGIHDRAASFLLKAGLRAAELNAYATARQHLQSARTAASDAKMPSADRYQLLAHLEAVLNVLGRRNEQGDVIAEMTALIGSRSERRGDLERRSAWLQAHIGNFAAAELSARRSVAVERKRADRPALAASLVALGTCLRWSGRPGEAVSHLEAAVEAADGDKERLAEALTELSSTLVELQRSDEAKPLLGQALVLSREMGDLRAEAEISGIQARGFRQEGDHVTAVASYENAIELCRRIGYRHGEGVNLVNISNLHHLAGRVADALAGYDEAARIFAELGNLRGEAMVLANAASARHTLLGDDGRAEADAARARRHFTFVGDQVGEAQCMEILAGVADRQGRYDEARQLLEDGLQALSGTGDHRLEVQHLRSMARFFVGRGEPQSALDLLDRAERLCGEPALGDLAVELLSIRGTALLAIGRTGEARAITRRAAERLTPGVERPYLIQHWHAAAARATGSHSEARQATTEAHRLLELALAGLSPEERVQSLTRVPEHREIVAAATKIAPQTVEVLLPAVGAPTGRPLGDDETRLVVWTVDQPEDTPTDSPIDRRRRRLLRLLAEAGDQGAVPSIEQVAAALDVSDSTVRRDLAVLRESGHPITTRGQRRQVS
jgi:predicted ATPase/DNA-binding transcriptional ArsR family regulator